MGEGKSKRKTGITLTSMKEEGIEESKVSANEESVVESIELLIKQVDKLKSQFHKHVSGQRSCRYSNSTYYPRTSTSFASSGLYRKKDYERGEKDYGMLKFEKNGKGIKCHECEGFGHIQSEFITYFKRKKKSLVGTLSDEENYSESDDEEVGMTLIISITVNEEGVENVIS
ncbi:uncharacterized protein E5676_scaffold4540G00050 [Cucumis melo var. makuwa]|uniref:Gag-pol polyprotein n=1 Tax=Cucumis melo var. makuwa TaxID=1194695 RepID=A0A5D3DSW2_CUCMM|nr:uncharacterized protein E6C27_scaffold376G00050 [Cucumis melo var. makuwa]TYK26857.1 uncharacterized protein E5676_scaffold4540G00050 [Cucumis melo var. makuwa]